ncbi:MAG: integrin alpha, partial [Planctomycetes bacterium]|nr:integrin alpha [Planctomycetota bacterium]
MRPFLVVFGFLFFNFSLTAQSPIWTVNGDFAYVELGNSCAAVGDFTGDGIAEIISGAPYQNNNGQ